MTRLHRTLIAVRIVAMLYAAGALLVTVLKDGMPKLAVWGGGLVAIGLILGITAWEEWNERG